MSTKLCINCKHHEKVEPVKPAKSGAIIPPSRMPGHYCRRPLADSVVDGSPRRMDTMCETERAQLHSFTGSPSNCGPAGYHYMAKEANK